jgi:hypothetical protein
MDMEVGAHQTQTLNDDGIPNRVEHSLSRLAITNKLLCTKYREVLRNIRLLHSKLLYQCPGGEFPTAQGLKDGDPRWVSKRLKDVGLESAQ